VIGYTSVITQPPSAPGGWSGLGMSQVLGRADFDDATVRPATRCARMCCTGSPGRDDGSGRASLVWWMLIPMI